MPRIRNWQKLVFYRPEKASRYENIDQLFRETVDWSKLTTYWQDLMRVILSIKAGKILPSVLLRKLGNYSRKNKLYQAFGELGHVVRTGFLLQYISDPPLRHGITATTNKVESYHSFTDWITFGGEALVSVYDSEEHEKWIKYTDLVANAVMLQNAVNLTQLLKELQTERYEFGRKEVARLSPYLRKHLRRFGDYVFSLEEVPPPITEELLSIELPEKQTDSASEFSPEIQSEVSTENPSELEVEELTDAEDESEVSG